MRVQHYLRASYPVDWGVNAIRGQLRIPIPLEGGSTLVKDDHIARPRFGPMEPKGQNKVTVGAARNGYGKVIVDSLFKVIEHGEPVSSS
jgi:hypothetical protein